ncbi:MAG TPA: hypothetical protein VI564_05860 [Candidatus Nanoarchaeia archaeon]|nr:hypothetical protein [Candidatus Nanoarchaeia archaeon]
MQLEKFIERHGTKPISKSAFAKCVESTFGNSHLAELIRNDPSFNVVLVSSGDRDTMKVRLVKLGAQIPEYDSYCGDSIKKAVERLPYSYLFPHGSSYPSSIKLF